jgi:haloalkane dehalogenase
MTATMTGVSEIRVAEISVLGSTMAYREATATNTPVALFLHGNPTSSFIWRNIIPHVAPVARSIAPDLIGFGQSAKPPIAYRFADHVIYLDDFLDRLGIKSAYIVAQDWGTALAFELAARRPDFVKGLAFMEFIRPMPTWDDFHQTTTESPHAQAARATFQQFRTPGVGEEMVLGGNAFVERILPGSIVRSLTEGEMAAYRAPFPTPESRKPVLAFPRELPIAGEPADVWARLEAAHAALRRADFPKLLFVGNPGALVTPDFALRFAASLRHCHVVQLPSGRHYLQEDHPDAIGHAIAGWIAGIEAATARAGLPRAA